MASPDTSSLLGSLARSGLSSIQQPALSQIVQSEVTLVTLFAGLLLAAYFYITRWGGPDFDGSFINWPRPPSGAIWLLVCSE